MTPREIMDARRRVLKGLVDIRMQGIEVDHVRIGKTSQALIEPGHTLYDLPIVVDETLGDEILVMGA